MTGKRAAFWLLFAAMLAVYLAMALWTLPAISDAAGGSTPFDLRPTGYAPDEARGFLGALSEAGRALYLGPQKWLDMAYPALLCAVLCLALWHLAPPWAGLIRGALIVLAVAAGGFDYLENIRVRAMLLALPDAVTDQMIRAASHATVMKSALTSVAFLALIWMLLYHAVKWLRKDKT